MKDNFIESGQSFERDPFLIDDYKEAETELGILTDRLKSGDEKEKEKAIIGLSALGWKCPGIQLPTAQALIDLSATIPPDPTLAYALREKASQLHLPLTLDRPLPEGAEEKLIELVDNLVKMIKVSNGQPELRAEAIPTISSFAASTGRKAEILTALKTVLADEENWQDIDMVLKEVCNLVEPGDEETIQALLKREKLGFASDGAKMAFIYEVEQVGDARFLPILNNLSNDENKLVQETARLAIKKIGERGQSEQ